MDAGWAKSNRMKKMTEYSITEPVPLHYSLLWEDTLFSFLPLLLDDAGDEESCTSLKNLARKKKKKLSRNPIKVKPHHQVVLLFHVSSFFWIIKRMSMEPKVRGNKKQDNGWRKRKRVIESEKWKTRRKDTFTFTPSLHRSPKSRNAHVLFVCLLHERNNYNHKNKNKNKKKRA